MWERMLDDILAVMFAIISALICSYVMVCTGSVDDPSVHMGSLWLLLGAFGVIYGGVLATSQARGIHYLLILPMLLWIVIAWESLRLGEHRMVVALKCTGAAINLLCLLLMTWSRRRKKP